MTCEEFSNQFDVQINSYSSQLPFGYSQDALKFDEYEKSVFLTEAQNELVIALYNGNNAIFKESFEETEQLRKYLTDLVCSKEVTTLVENTEKPPFSTNNDSEKYYKITFTDTDKVLFIIWEGVKIGDKFRDVVPVKYDEWLRISRNPFRQPNAKWRALRLDTGTNTIELISAAAINSYHVRYLKKPSPIVLQDFTGEGVSLNGEVVTKTECELNEVLHPFILNLAIQKALTSRALNNKS